MAGIRGSKNPYPTKPDDATGVFKQRGSGASFENKDTLSYSRSGSRKDPVKRNSPVGPAGKSHYQNQGLKRGTAK